MLPFLAVNAIVPYSIGHLSIFWRGSSGSYNIFGVKFCEDVRNGLIQLRNEGFFEDLVVSAETSYLLDNAFHALLSPSPKDLHEIFGNKDWLEYPETVVEIILSYANHPWTEVVSRTTEIMDEVCLNASVPGLLLWIAKHKMSVANQQLRQHFLGTIDALLKQKCITTEEFFTIYTSLPSETLSSRVTHTLMTHA